MQFPCIARVEPSFNLGNVPGFHPAQRLRDTL
jgi:hypothetical protein